MVKKDRIKINSNFNPDEANEEYLRNGGIDGLRKNNMKKIITFAIIFFILGFAISQLFFTGDKRTSTEENTTEETEVSSTGQKDVSTGKDYLSVSEQPFGDSVVISDLNLAETVWVTIYEDIDGELGNILGAGIFNAGSYKNEKIELLRNTEGDSKYYIKLLKDDGDRVFDQSKDLPARDSKTKKEIIVSFKTTSGMPR
jgi:hypothetical protein